MDVSRSRSLALTVLHRTHPAERPFDALVVVPADAVADRGERLVAGTLLPMPGMDGFLMRPKNPSAAASSGEGPLAPVGRAGPQRPMRSGHPGRRQWRPRPERARGCAPSGSESAALAGIPSASPASGPGPAVYAAILPSWQSTGGERHAFPSPALIPGDVRGPLPVRHPGREIAAGEVAGSRRRPALA